MPLLEVSVKHKENADNKLCKEKLKIPIRQLKKELPKIKLNEIVLPPIMPDKTMPQNALDILGLGHH